MRGQVYHAVSLAFEERLRERLKSARPWLLSLNEFPLTLSLSRQGREHVVCKS